MTLNLFKTKQPEQSRAHVRPSQLVFREPSLDRGALLPWKRRTTALIVVALTIAACRQPATASAQIHRYTKPPKILVLRGVFEVFSLGMNDLTKKLAHCGYDVKVTSWSLALYEVKCASDQPYVVIGHSLGGRMCAWVSRKLMACGKRVPLIIIVDANLIQPIPANVEKCLHLYVTNELGIFHGHPVRGESPYTQIVNWDVSKGQPSWFRGGVNHFDIDATPWVHQIIIDEIAKTFPPPRARRASRQPARRPRITRAARSDLTLPVSEKIPPFPRTSSLPPDSSETATSAPEREQRPPLPVWRPYRPKPSLRNGTQQQQVVVGEKEGRWRRAGGSDIRD